MIFFVSLDLNIYTVLFLSVIKDKVATVFRFKNYLIQLIYILTWEN